MIIASAPTARVGAAGGGDSREGAGGSIRAGDRDRDRLAREVAADLLDRGIGRPVVRDRLELVALHVLERRAPRLGVVEIEAGARVRVRRVEGLDLLALVREAERRAELQIGR